MTDYWLSTKSSLQFCSPEFMDVKLELLAAPQGLDPAILGDQLDVREAMIVVYQRRLGLRACKHTTNKPVTRSECPRGHPYREGSFKWAADKRVFGSARSGEPTYFKTRVCLHCVVHRAQRLDMKMAERLFDRISLQQERVDHGVIVIDRGADSAEHSATCATELPTC